MRKLNYILTGFIAVCVGVLATMFIYYSEQPQKTTPPVLVDTAEVPDIHAVSPISQQGINNTKLSIPEGWSMNIFAKDLTNPRVLITDPVGVVLASVPSKGEVVALPDSNNDGTADAKIVVVKDLYRPHGMAFVCNPDCLLYIAEPNRVGEYSYDTVSKKAVFVRTVAQLPAGGRNLTRTLLPVPSEYVTRLLVSVGSSCDACEETDPRRAAVLEINLNSITPKTAPFAQGLRNSVFMTTNPLDNQVWATEMGRDYLTNDTPPDEINIIEQGKNYGWPYCYGKNIRDPHVGFASIECTEPPYTPSYINIPAHSSPLGLAFVPEDHMTGGWPAEYWNNLFVAYHGSWNRDIPTGYKIVRYKINEDGTLQKAQDFITGFIVNNEKIIGRPTDILIQPGGVMYISDDTVGVIYRLSFQPPKQKIKVSVINPIIETPTEGQTIKSPMVVKGSAPGNWYFEGSFPVELKDEKGKSLAIIPAKAKGDWMTTGYVPFEVSIPFKVKSKQKGTLILRKDNPSGLPENDQSIEIPLILKP